jgi:ferritin-like metal-binding protein YciE
MDTLRELFIHELQDLYSAEQQILKALPKMAAAANSPDLRDAFQSHLAQTKDQVKRLDSIFEELDESPKGKTCKGMEGLVEEGSEIVSENAESAVKDAGLIVAAQKVEHYEIAGYGSVCVFAGLLGLPNIKQLLKQTMAEEEEADKKLTRIAEGIVNVEALTDR